MKKITFLMVCILSVSTAISQITLTHSTDPTTIDGGIVCSNDEPNAVSSWRVFDMTEFGVTDSFLTESVQWGASSLTGAVDFEVTLVLHALEGDITAEPPTLTEIASETVIMQEADAGVLNTTPLVATVPQGTILVFEVRYPNDGVTFPAAGSNEGGQTAPSYASGDCIPAIQDIMDFALTNSFTMNVIGENFVLSVDENALSQISIFPNPASDNLQVRVPSSVEITGASLFDVLGRNAGVTISNGQINVSDLARGVYILNLDTTAGTLTQKVVVE